MTQKKMESSTVVDEQTESAEQIMQAAIALGEATLRERLQADPLAALLLPEAIHEYRLSTRAGLEALRMVRADDVDVRAAFMQALIERESDSVWRATMSRANARRAFAIDQYRAALRAERDRVRRAALYAQQRGGR